MTFFVPLERSRIGKDTRTFFQWNSDDALYFLYFVGKEAGTIIN